ncbi:MAG TPA: 4-alpha-glucanotransferase, partial [Actinomycetota bacterium]|nr:4-alpha-glucanotransferase [Actinomycetota bacterium]
ASMASPNTHDMWPFAAWWDADDVDDRVELEILDEGQADDERKGRAAVREKLAETWGLDDPDAASAMDACIKTLGASDAATAVVSIEDLWGERDPQNVPGIAEEYPSWRKRLALSTEAFRHDTEVLRRLQELNDLRERKGADHDRPDT